MNFNAWEPIGMLEMIDIASGHFIMDDTSWIDTQYWRSGVKLGTFCCKASSDLFAGRAVQWYWGFCLQKVSEFFYLCHPVIVEIFFLFHEGPKIKNCRQAIDSILL